MINIRLIIFLLYYLINCLLAKDSFSIALTAPMLLLCVFGVATLRSKWFSFDDMTWIIAYLFFTIGPLQALDHGHIADGPVDSIVFTNTQLIEAMASIFLFFTVFLALRIFYQSKNQNSDNIVVGEAALLWLFIVTITSFVGVVAGFGGFTNLLATRYDKEMSQTSIIAYPSEALQMVSVFFIGLVFSRSKGGSKLFSGLLFAVSLILLAVCQNPGNAPRYFLLAAWLPVIYILFKGKIPVYAAYGTVFAAIMILMPILNLTSREGKGFSDAINNIDFGAGLIRLPFVDVFDMSAFEVLHMENKNFYLGQKTLGLIFFFVPREIWVDKATLMGLDLGAILEDNKIAGTANLSFFVAGDFYADGGLIAVVIGAFAINFLLCRILLFRSVLINGLELKTTVLTAAMPILIRGPLGANLGLTFMELILIAIFTIIFGSNRGQLNPVERPSVTVYSN